MMFLKGEHRTMDDLNEILRSGAIKSSGDNEVAVVLTTADLQRTIDNTIMAKELKGEDKNNE